MLDHLINIVVGGALITFAAAGILLPIGGWIYILVCRVTGRPCRLKIAGHKDAGMYGDQSPRDLSIELGTTSSHSFDSGYDYDYDSRISYPHAFNE